MSSSSNKKHILIFGLQYQNSVYYKGKFVIRGALDFSISKS